MRWAIVTPGEITWFPQREIAMVLGVNPKYLGTLWKRYDGDYKVQKINKQIVLMLDPKKEWIIMSSIITDKNIVIKYMRDNKINYLVVS